MQANSLIVLPILKKFKLFKGAELGVRRGDFCEPLLENIPELDMICVDLWNTHISINENHDHENNYSIFLNKLNKYISKDRVTVYKQLTTEAANNIENESLDFIFIDATHTYKGVSEDIEYWCPKVKKTGLIIGHDYANEFDNGGVVKAINEKIGISKVLSRVSDDLGNLDNVLNHLENGFGGIADKQTGCWFCWKNQIQINK